jgi:hypothetical protein
MVGNTDTSARNSNRPLPLLRVGRSGGRSHLLARALTGRITISASRRFYPIKFHGVAGRSTGWPNRIRLPKASITPVSSAPDRGRVGIGPGLVFCLLSKPRVQSGAGISLSIQNGDGFGVPGPSRSAGPVVAATQPLAQNTFLTLPNAALPGRLRLRN